MIIEISFNAILFIKIIAMIIFIDSLFDIIRGILKKEKPNNDYYGINHIIAGLIRITILIISFLY